MWSNADVNQLRARDYLRADYIAALCETLSPLRATRSDDDPQMIVVDRDRDGVSFMSTPNFHEGDGPHRLSRSGTLRFGDSAHAEFRLKVPGPDRFILVRDGAELRFRYVDKAERWVGNAVLAGTYRDASGAEYRFGRDGIATFPGRRPFLYTLAMDHVMSPYDYIDGEKPDAS